MRTSVRWESLEIRVRAGLNWIQLLEKAAGQCRKQPATGIYLITEGVARGSVG